MKSQRKKLRAPIERTADYLQSVEHLDNAPELGRVYLIKAPFDTAIELGGADNLFTAKDVAYAVVGSGGRSKICQYATPTREAIIFKKGQQPLLVLDSPLLDLSVYRDLTKTNNPANHQEWFRLKDIEHYQELLQQAEEDKRKTPEERRVMVLSEFWGTNKLYMTRGKGVLKALFKEYSEEYYDYIWEKHKSPPKIRGEQEGIIEKSDLPLIEQLIICSPNLSPSIYARNFNELYLPHSSNLFRFGYMEKEK